MKVSHEAETLNENESCLENFHLSPNSSQLPSLPHSSLAPSTHLVDNNVAAGNENSNAAFPDSLFMWSTTGIIFTGAET